MKAERDYLVEVLKQSGARGKIHGSLKALKNCSDIHVCAVLRTGEKFTRSGSKKRYADQEGQRKQRNKLFVRETGLHVVIADSDEEKVESILTAFLKRVAKGVAVDGNWVGIEVGEADWLEGEDSILKSKVVVELDVTLTGGIYEDVDIAQAQVGKIDGKEKRYGG